MLGAGTCLPQAGLARVGYFEVPASGRSLPRRFDLAACNPPRSKLQPFGVDADDASELPIADDNCETMETAKRKPLSSLNS